MIEALRKHIIKRLGDNIDNLELVLTKFKSLETKKNEQLLTQGEISLLMDACKFMFMTVK
jgi:uncharacterized protein YacL (UPF0231 family)